MVHMASVGLWVLHKIILREYSNSPPRSVGQEHVYIDRVGMYGANVYYIQSELMMCNIQSVGAILTWCKLCFVFPLISTLNIFNQSAAALGESLSRIPYRRLYSCCQSHRSYIVCELVSIVYSLWNDLRDRFMAQAFATVTAERVSLNSD